MQPAAYLRPETLKAPHRRRLVEVLPRPLDDDQHSPDRKGGRDAVEHLGGIGHVMEGRGGDDRIDVGRELGCLELDLTVVLAVGRLRVDTQRS